MALDQRSECVMAGVREDLVRGEEGRSLRKKILSAVSGNHSPVSLVGLLEAGLEENEAEILLRRIERGWEDHLDSSGWAKKCVNDNYERRSPIGGWSPLRQVVGRVFTSPVEGNGVSHYHGTSVQSALRILETRPLPSKSLTHGPLGKGFYLTRNREEALSWARSNAITPSLLEFRITHEALEEGRRAGGCEVEGEVVCVKSDQMAAELEVESMEVF